MMKNQFFLPILASLFLMNALHASAPELNRVIDQILSSDISTFADIDPQTESQFYESLKIDSSTFWQTFAPQIASQAEANKTSDSCNALLRLASFKTNDSAIRIEHAQKALTIAKELNDQRLILDAFLIIARIPHQGNLVYAQEALAIAKELKDQRLSLDALLIIARIPHQGNLVCAQEALAIATNRRDLKKIEAARKIISQITAKKRPRNDNQQLPVKTS
ncbi:MAG: hypothetical protein CNLJKLNK_00442 [Holosporales bacterium]